MLACARVFPQSFLPSESLSMIRHRSGRHMPSNYCCCRSTGHCQHSTLRLSWSSLANFPPGDTLTGTCLQTAPWSRPRRCILEMIQRSLFHIPRSQQILWRYTLTHSHLSVMGNSIRIYHQQIIWRHVPVDIYIKDFIVLLSSFIEMSWSRFL